MYVLGEDTPTWLFRECEKYIIREFRGLQSEKRFSLSFRKLSYDTVARGNMRLVLKVLSPLLVIDPQSDIFDDVNRMLSMVAKDWASSFNTNRPQSKSNFGAPKQNGERTMCTPPRDLTQWAGDAFQYAEPIIVKTSEQQNDESRRAAGDNDLVFLVSLAMLVIKMQECSKSDVGGNITIACNQHAVCSSYATTGPRWIFTLTEFPLA